jgi:hypothetical protein
MTPGALSRRAFVRSVLVVVGSATLSGCLPGNSSPSAGIRSTLLPVGLTVSKHRGRTLVIEYGPTADDTRASVESILVK